MQSGRLAGPLASRFAVALATVRCGPHAKIRACRADRLHFRRTETIVLRRRYLRQVTRKISRYRTIGTGPETNCNSGLARCCDSQPVTIFDALVPQRLDVTSARRRMILPLPAYTSFFSHWLSL